MRKHIPKISPLSGTEKQQTEQLRTQMNRAIEEMNRTLTELDKEIEKLKKETSRNG